MFSKTNINEIQKTIMYGYNTNITIHEPYTFSNSNEITHTVILCSCVAIMREKKNYHKITYFHKKVQFFFL